MINTDQELIQAFLADRPRNTRDNYARHIRQFLYRLHRDTPSKIADVDYNDLSDFRSHLVDLGLKRNSVTVKVRCITSLLGFAHDLGYIDSNPGTLFNRKSRGLLKREPTTEAKIADQVDIMRVLEMEGNDLYRLFMDTLYRTGMRVSEALQIDVGLIVAKEGSHSVPVERKGGQVAYVYLPESLYLRLTDTSCSKPFNFTRQYAHRFIKAAGVRAGVPGLSAHWFRHAFCSHSLANGATIAQVKEGAGHSNLASTSVYTHALGHASDYLPNP